MPDVPYAELHAHSAYSFLDGASLPEELVERACELGLRALALTDHDGFPGAVRLAEAARRTGLPVAFGTELSLGPDARTARADPPGERILLLARDAQGYRRLSRTVGLAMLAAGRRGAAHYDLEALAEASRGAWMVLTGCRKSGVNRALEGNESGRGPRNPREWDLEAAAREVEALIALFGQENVAVELTNDGAPLDRERCAALAEVAERAGVPCLATGNVHCAEAADRPVADVLAATRARTDLDGLEHRLPVNRSYLRSGARMLALHRDHPEAVAAAARVGAECAFDLALVAPGLPDFPVPEGHTPASWLRSLTYAGTLERYGTRAGNPRAWEAVDHELGLIVALDFPGYFLIVEEIVAFCRRRGIWCQGRGSAANSAVCFALGITAVDAVRHRMLFERFLSPGRSGPPDIDLDIESSRREEVIQHVYRRYGRRCAAMVANTITYRPRSAIRDAAKALGYDPGQADRWAASVSRHAHADRRPAADAPEHGRPGCDGVPPRPDHAFTSAGEGAPIPRDVAAMASRLQELPRHLGVHPGGMVLCDRPVVDVCPVSWAAMPGRTVLQWDKDDCAEAGLVKFDLLGLGTLTALRIAFARLAEAGERGDDGKPLALYNLPQEDPRVYALLQAADTVGVFQVESRAQMAALPRLRPACLYDVVIQVALIRPGPIQGDAVTPYINRRLGREAVTYPHPLARPALERTLGVPLFQEQFMQIAIDVAGFSPAQADRLRKAMSAKRSRRRMQALKAELMDGMAARGVDEATGEEIYAKLRAFAEFGFPESHAFSFAYLVYASAWLKVHHPAHFYAGILAAQPMGFYSHQSLVADAQRHGVRIGPPDVTRSAERALVRVGDPDDPAARGTAPTTPVSRLVTPHPRLEVRLGLDSVRGLGKAAQRICAERREAPFSDAADLAGRARLKRAQIEALAAAGALESLGVGRREGIWAAQALEDRTVRHGAWHQPPIPGTEALGAVPDLPAMSEAELVSADIAAAGTSRIHPIRLLRQELAAQGILRVLDVEGAEAATRIRVAGVVTHRQRPPTAGGVTFVSLEDETGLLNVVCSPGLWVRYRDVAGRSSGLVVRGTVERVDGATSLLADALQPLALGARLPSRDFR